MAEEPDAQLGPVSATVSLGSVGGGGGRSAGLCTFPFQLKSRFELKICRLASRAAAVRIEEVPLQFVSLGESRQEAADTGSSPTAPLIESV